MKSTLNSLLWGISVALSWTWGLGLFFSVQISLQFGLSGLLCFAIPNALGLIGFGILTQRIARKYPKDAEFEKHFFRTSHSLRYIFLVYQLVAITLTFFAIFRYLFEPLGVNLSLVVLLVLGAALLLGENFNISRIKWSHFAMFGVILLSMVGIFFGLSHYLATNDLTARLAPGEQSSQSLQFFGFVVPMVTGLLVGPWLDLQQWHRAIQIHREKTSIAASYLSGGLIFFCILLFHGTLALVVWPLGHGGLVIPAADGLFHAKDAIVRFLFVEGNTVSWVLKYSYILFICLCIVSTLDSGYVSLRWYLRELVKKSESVVTSIVPTAALSSPIPSLLLAVVVAVASVPLRFELEYFMSFYAAFSVAYAIVYLFRSVFQPRFTNFTQTTLFAVASFSLGLFGVGYFNELWMFMVLGSLFPIVYGVTVISARAAVDDLQRAVARDEPTGGEEREESISGKAAERAVATLENAISRIDPKTAEKFHEVIQRVEPQAAQLLAGILGSVQPGDGELTLARPIEADAEIEHAKGHFEGKWFCHTFMTTYQDTNSVGNVYFGMYCMYVGKVREMFFEACMPDFDLRDTKFYILTRQFEHKFNVEAREFDLITVKIRVASFNRKFATLEHQIFNQAKTLLGKGKQVLLFVNSKDYGIIDLPAEVQRAFLPHI